MGGLVYSSYSDKRCNKQRTRVNQNLSPLILLASWRSLVMMVTLLAWMAQRLVSSKRETRQASAASWRARTAELWNRSSCLNSWAISRTSLWKGSFLMRRSVDFWYFLISLRATVPGLNRWGFLTPVVTGADLRAIFWATNCFLGTFCAVDFLAVCLVRAIKKVYQFNPFTSFENRQILSLQRKNLIGQFATQSKQNFFFPSDKKLIFYDIFNLIMVNCSLYEFLGNLQYTKNLFSKNIFKSITIKTDF